MDDIKFNELSSGAIDSERQVPKADSSMADKANDETKTGNITKKDIETFFENTKVVTDTVDNFCSVMLTPDGRPIDFSDKDGRTILRQNIAANTKILGEVKTSLGTMEKEVLKRIPSRVEAVFCDDDRKRLDKFFDYYRRAIIISVIVGAILGVLFISGIFFYVQGLEYKQEAESHALSLESKTVGAVGHSYPVPK